MKISRYTNYSPINYPFLIIGKGKFQNSNPMLIKNSRNEKHEVRINFLCLNIECKILKLEAGQFEIIPQIFASR